MYHLAFLATLCAWAISGLRAAETIPPAPQNHFNDYAQVVSTETANRLNRELAEFERETSNQIVVAIFPRMASNSSVEDYTVRVAQSWGAGGKAKNNGAVLFMFQESHDIRIVTGYGLEGALPDALCKQIIENEMIPAFRRGDFATGLSAGVHAMMAATKGEYQGVGRTVRETTRNNGSSRGPGGIGVIIVILFIVFSSIFGRRRNVLYQRRGRRGFWMGPGPGGFGGGGFGGGNWGGGGGGGTFSGGGGSFGGGGAGGRW